MTFVDDTGWKGLKLSPEERIARDAYYRQHQLDVAVVNAGTESARPSQLG